MWVSNDERRARVSKGYRKAVFFGRTESSFGLTVLVLVSGVVSQGIKPVLVSYFSSHTRYLLFTEPVRQDSRTRDLLLFCMPSAVLTFEGCRVSKR